MRKRIIAYCTLGLVAGFVLIHPPNLTSEEANPSCTTCPQCTGLPGTTHHEAPLGGGGFWGNGGHGCWDVACGHPSCDSHASLDARKIDEEINNLLEKAYDGDTGAAMALVNVYPEHAIVNNKRNAIQVSSACESAGIVAHIPLTTRMVAAIEARRKHVEHRTV